MPSQISWELDKVEVLGSGDKTDPSMSAQGQDISLCNGSERNKCAAEGLSREWWWSELRLRAQMNLPRLTDQQDA